MSSLLKSFADQRHGKLSPAPENSLTDLAAAKELLYEFNHTIMMNDVRGEDKAPPEGEYPVTRAVFNTLQEIAAGNPMADHRKDTHWKLSVNRGGVLKRIFSLGPGTGVVSFHPELPSLTCRFPHYDKAERWYVLRFVAPVLGG